MKKSFFVLFFLLLASVVMAQRPKIIECPPYAIKDTLVYRTRVVRDIYFSQTNDTLAVQDGYTFYGPIDLDLKLSVAASTDSMSIEVYALKRKIIEGATTFETVAIDSHRVATLIPLTTTATWKSYPIDPLWTYFPNCVGIRVVYKPNYTTIRDADSDTMYANLELSTKEGR